MSDFAAWIQLIRDGGLALAVLALIVGGARGWYHWDNEFRAMRQDRDDWKAIALRGAKLAERALETPPPPRST